MSLKTLPFSISSLTAPIPDSSIKTTTSSSIISINTTTSPSTTISNDDNTSLNNDIPSKRTSISTCSPHVQFLTKTSIPYDILAKVVRELTFVETSQKYSPLDPKGDKLLEFIEGLLKETKPTGNIIVACAIYFRRVHSVHPEWVSTFPSCLLFTGCLILAFKFVQDAPHNYNLWTVSSGFKSKVLNKTERSLLELLNCELYVSFEHHEIWLQHIVNISNSIINNNQNQTISQPPRARAAVRGRPRRVRPEVSTSVISTTKSIPVNESAIKHIPIAPQAPVTVRHASYAFSVAPSIPLPQSQSRLPLSSIYNQVPSSTRSQSVSSSSSSKPRLLPLSSIYSQLPRTAHPYSQHPTRTTNQASFRSNRSYCVLPPISSLHLGSQRQESYPILTHQYQPVYPVMNSTMATRTRSMNYYSTPHQQEFVHPIGPPSYQPY